MEVKFWFPRAAGIPGIELEKRCWEYFRIKLTSTNIYLEYPWNIKFLSLFKTDSLFVHRNSSLFFIKSFPFPYKLFTFPFFGNTIYSSTGSVKFILFPYMFFIFLETSVTFSIHFFHISIFSMYFFHVSRQIDRYVFHKVFGANIKNWHGHQNWPISSYFAY